MSDYLSWQSNLSLETVFAGREQQSYPQYWRDGMLYVTSLLKENGRTVVMLRRNDETTCVTPAPFNLGSKFSEYGGKPYWLFGDLLFFVNREDQCLYRQSLTKEDKPKRVSPLPTGQHLWMYADLVQLSTTKLLAIVEQESIEQKYMGGDDRENTAYIALLDFEKIDSPPTILQSGADFYSNLCFDPNRKTVAWVQWNHPNMPWDETELWLASLDLEDTNANFIDARKVELEPSASVCQLLFANNGLLFCSADFAGKSATSAKNYWNVYALDAQLEKPEIEQITAECSEFGYPHWQYGDSRIVQFDTNTLLTFASQAEQDVVYKIDQQTLEVEQMPMSGVGLQNLSADGNGRAVAVLLSRYAVPELAEFTVETGEFTGIEPKRAVLDKGEISVAQHFSFGTSEQGQAHGFYYPPCNATYTVDAPPPLIVMVHGGPTARADGFFEIQKQFWTQRGFAIFDVNHRGSSGYGRAFRDELYGEWGEKDTADIVAGIRYLIDAKKADPSKVCIRGKSAGGYAVLRALTQYPEIFCAGACYYGIGNLVTLAEVTHKFEKHYADRLLGEPFSPETAALKDSRFYTRSPINDIGNLQSAMIVFQGLADKVVPPAVAHEIIAALKQRGLPHVYVEYADEGHGFRQAANNIDSCRKELEFYRQNLNLPS